MSECRVVLCMKGEAYPRTCAIHGINGCPEIAESPSPVVPTFGDELRALINKHSKENASNTPDHILAGYLLGCLQVYDSTVRSRDVWYGR